MVGTPEISHSLLHRIHRRYQTVTLPLRFGDIVLDFTRIADPDRVLDQVCAEEDRREKLSGVRTEDPAHLPYWAQLWDSAGALANWIASKDLTDASVLDLGCGLGLCGAVAAACGAKVMLADLEPPALLFARLNCLHFNARARQLDWRWDHLGEKFDLILGADILYERKQWEFLESFWREHLSDGGRILLGEPGRQTGEMFVPWIKERGWELTEFREPNPFESGKTIRIFELLTPPVANDGWIAA
jgi:predicted nicotinamide N-methyase